MVQWVEKKQRVHACQGLIILIEQSISETSENLPHWIPLRDGSRGIWRQPTIGVRRCGVHLGPGLSVLIPTGYKWGWGSTHTIHINCHKSDWGHEHPWTSVIRWKPGYEKYKSYPHAFDLGRVCGHMWAWCNNDVMHKLEFVSDTSTACFAKGWYGSFHGIVPCQSVEDSTPRKGQPRQGSYSGGPKLWRQVIQKEGTGDMIQQIVECMHIHSMWSGLKL